MIGESEWLESLRPGDEVLCSGRVDNIVKVERVTASMIVVGGERFSKKTGGLIGYRDGYFCPTLHELTNEKREEIERQRLIFKLCQLSFRHFQNVPTAAIRDFVAVMESSKEVQP